MMRFRRLPCITLLVSLALLAPTTLLAHAHLKRATPASGAHLAELPRVIRLEFSESPELSFSAIRLIAPSGTPVSLGSLEHDSANRNAVVAAILGDLDAGVYRVQWQVAGDDGHPVHGSYEFVIAPGAAGNRAAIDTDRPAPPPRDSLAPIPHHNPVTMPQGAGFGVESPLYVVLRWAQFVGLLLVIGAVAFHHFILGAARRSPAEERRVELTQHAALDRHAATIGRGATLLLALTLIGRLFAQSVAMHGARAAVDATRNAQMILHTVWGVGWLVELAGILITGFGLLAARRSEPAENGGATGWLIATLGIVILAFSPAFSGHAASMPTMRALAVLADGLHVLGAGGWLGTLAVIFLTVLLRGGGETAHPTELVRLLLNAFSPLALASAGLAVVTGVFAGWIHVGTIPNLWRTRYGVTLLVKLVFLVVAACAGAYNWRVAQPRLGAEGSLRSLRRSSSVELSMAVLILLVTAILVALPTSLDADM